MSETLGPGAAFVYGVIQGITEFLPISSDGHLKLAHRLGLGALPGDLELPFDVLLHAGTVIAMVIGFRNELFEALKLPMKVKAFMFLSMLPVAIAGLTFAKPIVVAAGEQLWTVGLCYLANAILLFVAERLAIAHEAKGEVPAVDLGTVNLRQSLWVGILQVFALLPGVSRSGSTIAGGLISGMSAPLAVTYSFLIGLPLIAAAVAKDALDGGFGALNQLLGPTTLFAGFVASFVFGIFAIRLLRIVAGKRRMSWFAAYCLVVAIACFVGDRGHG